MTQIVLPGRANISQHPILAHNNRPVTRITKDDVIYSSDSFDWIHLTRIMSEYGTPGAIICDIECTILPTDVPCYFMPDIRGGMVGDRDGLVQELKEFVDINDQPNTLQCFNFSINRTSIDRHVMLKIIDWFGFESRYYSWAQRQKDFNMSMILDEMNSISADWLTAEFKKTLLEPIALKKQWFDLQQQDSPPHDQIQSWGTPENMWYAFRKEHTLCSAVSLIAEGTTNAQPNYTFSEKTLFPIMGMNFLIWAGNYGQAQKAKEMGIDIFEDVIDHSYQYQPTLLERCYYAVADNRRLLTDLDYSARIREKCMPRLLANRQYVMIDEMKSWTTKNRQSMPALVHHVLDNKLLFDQSQ